MEKHPHAEWIKAKADGNVLQKKYPTFQGFSGWVEMDADEWTFPSNHAFRIKPAEPEKLYPLTQMSFDDLYPVWKRSNNTAEALNNIANVALRHAVDNGYLVLPPECSPSARDMAIAQAVAAETVRELYAHSTRSQSEAIRAASQNTGRLAEIIESVKP